MSETKSYNRWFRKKGKETMYGGMMKDVINGICLNEKGTISIPLPPRILKPAY